MYILYFQFSIEHFILLLIFLKYFLKIFIVFVTRKHYSKTRKHGIIYSAILLDELNF